MKKNFYNILGFVLLCISLVFGSAERTRANVAVNVSLGHPVFVSEPSEMVMMPGTGIYFVPGADSDVFFYGGFWWSRRGDNWYRTNRYNGSWVMVRRNYVPVHVINVPRNYREVYRNERHVNYREWQNGNKEQYVNQNQKRKGGDKRNKNEHNDNRD